MKREIVLDTEMTGLSAENGDKLIAVGAVELIDGKQTGKTFYAEINPLRPVSQEVARIHELTDERLKDKPTFPQIAQSFLDFIGASPLVIHNAPFDLAFLNAELRAAGFAPIAEDRIVDTLPIAKRLFPEQRVGLSDLCKMFEIFQGRPTPRAGKRRERTAGQEQPFCGALFDAQLLAKVYVCLRKNEFEDCLKTGNLNDIKKRYEDEAHIYAPLTNVLTRAAWFGRSDVCKWLVDEKGADVNARDDVLERTALMKAAERGYLDLCQWLVDEKGANINIKNSRGITPLMYAVENGHLDVCRWLVNEKRADVNAKEEDNGETALMYAALRGNSDIVTFLVEAGADVNETTKDGWTALMTGAMSGVFDVVRFLTEHGAGINVKAYYGTTAYILATDGNYQEIARFLAEHGANVNAEDAYDETASSKPLTFFELMKTFLRMENHCLSKYEIRRKS